MAREISAQVDLSTPSPAPRRETAQEKARRLQQESRGAVATRRLSPEHPPEETDKAEQAKVISLLRLTARVHPTQLHWLREKVKEYRAKSMGPKLTNDELTRISLNLLQAAVEKEGDIVTFVDKYRAGQYS